MDEENVGYLYNRHYLAVLKKKEVMISVGKLVELGKIILSEVTPMPKDKYGMYSPICGYLLLSQ